MRRAALANIDKLRRCSRGRRGEGATRATGRGVMFGRKPGLTPGQINHARKLIDRGEARRYVAGVPNVGRSTLYRALELNGRKGGG